MYLHGKCFFSYVFLWCQNKNRRDNFSKVRSLCIFNVQHEWKPGLGWKQRARSASQTIFSRTLDQSGIRGIATVLVWVLFVTLLMNWNYIGILLNFGNTAWSKNNLQIISSGIASSAAHSWMMRAISPSGPQALCFPILVGSRAGGFEAEAMTVIGSRDWSRSQWLLF